jgi:hypothetical protein
MKPTGKAVGGNTTVGQEQGGGVFSPTNRQGGTRIWDLEALQILDFTRPRFRKNDFAHSLTIHSTRNGQV